MAERQRVGIVFEPDGAVTLVSVLAGSKTCDTLAEAAEAMLRRAL